MHWSLTVTTVFKILGAFAVITALSFVVVSAYGRTVALSYDYVQEAKAWKTDSVRPVDPWYWWVLNDEGIDPAYRPDDPQWVRAVMWYIRNPVWNFQKYVLGHEDKNFMASGDYPVFTTMWEEWVEGRCGWKQSVITLDNGARRYFVSYCSANWLYYAGWLPSGGRFGIKVNPRWIPRAWNAVKGIVAGGTSA